MADGMNKVMLLGNLGADPELRVTAGGQALLSLRIATTESWLDKSQVAQERTEWHTVVVWGKRGEALAPRLAKGDKVLVEGRLRTSSYEKDGQKRSWTEINATEVWLLGQKHASNGAIPRAPVAPVSDEPLDIPF